MADRGMSPSDFGLRVRSHPAGLVITAANKMRNGTPMMVSYSAGISETISFDRALGGNRKNHELLGRFIASLGAPGPVGSDNRFWNRVWRGVAGEQVADLLGGMSVHQASRKVRGDYMAGYIRSQNVIGGLVCWTVALISNPEGESTEVGGWEVHPVFRTPHPPDGLERDSVHSIRRLLNPTDEMLDLDKDQREQALDLTKQQHQEGSRHRSVPTRASGPNIRRVRNHRNGLLLLYSLQERDAEGLPFMGIAASFPAAERDTPINYYVNTVYWQEELEL